MNTSKNDAWVGLFVLIGAAALLFLALQSANLLSLNFEPTYKVTARFDNIGGLKPRAAVRSAGVVVGRVEAITFDDKTFQGSVVLALESRYAFPKDSSLKILTSGLLGEQYLGIEAGAEALHVLLTGRVEKLRTRDDMFGSLSAGARMSVSPSAQVDTGATGSVASEISTSDCS